jgi:hypothetical protein
LLARYRERDADDYVGWPRPEVEGCCFAGGLWLSKDKRHKGSRGVRVCVRVSCVFFLGSMSPLSTTQTSAGEEEGCRGQKKDEMSSTSHARRGGRRRRRADGGGGGHLFWGGNKRWRQPGGRGGGVTEGRAQSGGGGGDGDGDGDGGRALGLWRFESRPREKKDDDNDDNDGDDDAKVKKGSQVMGTSACMGYGRAANKSCAVAIAVLAGWLAGWPSQARLGGGQKRWGRGRRGRPVWPSRSAGRGGRTTTGTGQQEPGRRGWI